MSPSPQQVAQLRGSWCRCRNSGFCVGAALVLFFCWVAKETERAPFLDSGVLIKTEPRKRLDEVDVSTDSFWLELWA